MTPPKLPNHSGDDQDCHTCFIVCIVVISRSPGQGSDFFLIGPGIGSDQVGTFAADPCRLQVWQGEFAAGAIPLKSVKLHQQRTWFGMC